ncbi:Hypothetical predicted protein [Lecanosticta acicola]|uniref:Uncharacterized protein n=1 Tax=Lecanosticta acicola TaxID=111012 RepID=A0AAI8Z5D2_9PEZI|nr:Hypothetical predicted protein [Lecanosticta acicola]
MSHVLQYHSVKSRVQDDLSSLQPEDAFNKCMSYLQRSVAEHEEVQIAIQVSYQWMAQHYPARLRKWEQQYAHLDALRTICRNVEKQRKALERSTSMISANWPLWDWQIPSDMTPPHYSEKLLRALVELSNLLPKSDEDMQWAIKEIAHVAKTRLKAKRGRRTKHVEPADVRKVIDMVEAETSDSEQQQQEQEQEEQQQPQQQEEEDGASPSIEMGLNGPDEQLDMPSTPPAARSSLNSSGPGSLHDTTMQLMEDTQSSERPQIEQGSTIALLLAVLGNQALADTAAIRAVSHDREEQSERMARGMESDDASRELRRILGETSLPAHWYRPVERRFQNPME